MCSKYMIYITRSYKHKIIKVWLYVEINALQKDIPLLAMAEKGERVCFLAENDTYFTSIWVSHRGVRVNKLDLCCGPGRVTNENTNTDIR